MYIWGGTVFGPDDTPWEGGIFSMRLTFTDQYPDKPPRVRFTSEMVRSSIIGAALLCRQLVLMPHLADCSCSRSSTRTFTRTAPFA
jgi:ubiquitin-conjugating enzyme E2 A